jgi:hypothetical protein
MEVVMAIVLYSIVNGSITWLMSYHDFLNASPYTIQINT